MFVSHWNLLVPSVFQLSDAANKASHHMRRDHRGWWEWNASGKTCGLGKHISHVYFVMFSRTSQRLSLFAPSGSWSKWCCSSSHSPSVVLDHWATTFWSSFTQNAYRCWKGLGGSPWHVGASVCWDRGRGLWASSALGVGHASCALSGWPALPFTFCLPPVATNWQLTSALDQLRGTLRPRLMDALLGWRGCWQPVKLDFGGWLTVPELSDQLWGRSVLSLLLSPLQPLGGLRSDWSGLSAGPMSNNCQPWKFELYVPHGCFLSTTELSQQQDLFWILNRPNRQWNQR